jgi:hypothetical protein
LRQQLRHVWQVFGGERRLIFFDLEGGIEMVDQGPHILNRVHASSSIFLLAGFAGDLQILGHTISQNGGVGAADTLRDTWLICGYGDLWPRVGRDGGTFHNPIAAIDLASGPARLSAAAARKARRARDRLPLYAKSQRVHPLISVFPISGFGNVPANSKSRPPGPVSYSPHGQVTS